MKGLEHLKEIEMQKTDFDKVDRFLAYADEIEFELKFAAKCSKLEKKWGCPLEIIDKLIEQDKVVVMFHGEMQIYHSIKIDLRNKVIWYCRQTGGHYALRLPLSQYGIHFWLKEDKSE